MTEGMRFDKGYISGYFVTDAERMEAVLEDPYVLVVNSKISSLKDLLPVLEKVMQTGKPLLVIAEDVDGEALAGLIVNKIRGTFVDRGQGTRLRRAPQGHDGRRHPDRWTGHLRGGRPRADAVSLEHSAAPVRCRHQGRLHHRRRRGRRYQIAGRSPRSVARSRTLTPTTTARR